VVPSAVGLAGAGGAVPRDDVLDRPRDQSDALPSDRRDTQHWQL